MLHLFNMDDQEEKLKQMHMWSVEQRKWMDKFVKNKGYVLLSQTI